MNTPGDPDPDPDTVRVVVEHLVASSGIPASSSEIDGLVASAPLVAEAVRRLYAVPMDHETEPAVSFRAH